jgi:hypothetical protein
MTSKIDTAKAAIKNALYDESKPWYKLFNWAEAQTGVNRLNLFFGKIFKLNSVHAISGTLC